MSLPCYVTTMRKKLGFTQNQLAIELGITSRQISKIENLTVAPTKQTILAIECLVRRAGLYGEEQQQLPID